MISRTCSTKFSFCKMIQAGETSSLNEISALKSFKRVVLLDFIPKLHSSFDKLLEKVQNATIEVIYNHIICDFSCSSEVSQNR